MIVFPRTYWYFEGASVSCGKTSHKELTTQSHIKHLDKIPNVSKSRHLCFLYISTMNCGILETEFSGLDLPINKNMSVGYKCCTKWQFKLLS